ncbi:MAG: response regulator, partial [Aristaeellaceae bacterium]
MKYRVVIADDEAKIIRLIEELGRWEALDIEIVDTCTTGSAALESILQHRPDFVLSDIKMPGLDGLELISRVRGAGAAPLFILISGYRHFEYARTAVALGVMDYLLKPIDEAQLNETL